MRPPRALLVSAAMSLVLGSCGSDPAPAAWAAAVCTALAPWRAEIGELMDRAQNQMTAATPAAQAKENLVRLLAGAQAASETARAKVAAAGVPDVEGGAEIAYQFERSLAGVRDAYGRASFAIERLDEDDPNRFYDGVAAVLATLTEEYRRSALDTSRLHSVELQRAFDEVPECR